MTFTQLLKRLLRFPDYDEPRGYIAEHYYNVPVDENIRVESAAIEMQHRGGRVVTAAKHQDYSPDVRRTGGRVVKVMPRELKQIKKAQETLTDEDVTPATAGLSGN